MIISPRIAVVSLGVSCQTAHQIEAHASFVGERLGCEMVKCTTPFDWLYVPAAGAAAMLRDECYFPTDIGELQGPKTELAEAMTGGWRKPHWPKYDATFWHSKFDDPATFLSKAQHAADNLKRLCAADRRVFIVSNTQNNIARSMKDAGREPMNSEMTLGALTDLHEALTIQYWPCELYAVTADPRWGADRYAIKSDVVAHRFTPDRSTWEGDGKQWRKLFEEIVK